MKLSTILAELNIEDQRLGKDIEVTDLSENSKTVTPGTLFFARKGSRASGVDFVGEAVSRGARAILAEEPLEKCSVPAFQVESISQAESKISNLFYGNPSKTVPTIAVTGTNGKTTFTYLLESIAREMGWKVGVIGTINYRISAPGEKEGEIYPAPNTTPNALELQRMISHMNQRKVDLVLMEVSSHALSLGRTDLIDFDAGVFTNLTQDHLDFHGSMEEYFAAKSKLFRMIPSSSNFKHVGHSPAKCGKFAIINFDDPYGKRMAKISQASVKGFAIHSHTDYMASELKMSPEGSLFVLRSPKGQFSMKTHLLGDYNVYNALAAIATADQIGIPDTTIKAGLEKVMAIPGRLEPVRCGQNFTVLVDYAHTEDALRNVLGALRRLHPKRILTVFGCGGDRDRTKRPRMGVAGAELSDFCIITSDNPRSEDPEKIAAEVVAGIKEKGHQNYEVVLDREKAIQKIIKMAKEGDLVLLAGKGHETYQIFAQETISFDDREIAGKHLRGDLRCSDRFPND